jgi:hypothetical protein
VSRARILDITSLRLAGDQMSTIDAGYPVGRPSHPWTRWAGVHPPGLRRPSSGWSSSDMIRLFLRGDYDETYRPVKGRVSAAQQLVLQGTQVC